MRSNPETVAPSPGKNPPTMTIDVLPKDVNQIRNLKPGDGIKLIIHGEVVEKSEKEPSLDFPVGFAGSVKVEINKTEIQPWNDFSSLADEDD